MSMSVDEMIAVLWAHKEGKAIEVRISGKGAWASCSLPIWDFNLHDYRIKPEPPKKMVVPWTWKTMPFPCRVRHKSWNDDGWIMISKAYEDTAELAGSVTVKTYMLLKEYVQILPDGTEGPCGVEVEG